MDASVRFDTQIVGVLAMQEPEHFLGTVDDPQMRSQQIGVEAVPLGP